VTTHEFAAEAHLTGSELDDDSAPLALGAERFRPVEADDAQSRRVRTLRQEHRMRTQIRALLYAGRRFQTTTISDLSRSGAGIDAASGVLPGDLVALQLLDGRAIAGQVRWWLAGRCGIAFLEPLKDVADIVAGPLNRLKGPRAGVSASEIAAMGWGATAASFERVPPGTPQVSSGLEQDPRGSPGHNPIADAFTRDPYVAVEKDLPERLRERYARKYSGC
jgi:hypothetical protein